MGISFGDIIFDILGSGHYTGISGDQERFIKYMMNQVYGTGSSSSPPRSNQPVIHTYEVEGVVYEVLDKE